MQADGERKRALLARSRVGRRLNLRGRALGLQNPLSQLSGPSPVSEWLMIRAVVSAWHDLE